jgi:hypothetical protein
MQLSKKLKCPTLWNNDHARFMKISQVTEKFKGCGEQKQVTGGE